MSARRAEFVLAVGVGLPPTALRVEGTAVAAWLGEVLHPWALDARAPDAGGWTLEVSTDPHRHAALQALPGRAEGTDRVVLADDLRSSFISVSPGRVELCFDDRLRRGRMHAVWLIDEIARLSLGPGAGDLHASAIEVDGRAVLFLGRKKSGKTTLLLQVLAAGMGRFMGNDRAFVGVAGSGPWAAGTPLPVRIRASGLGGLRPRHPWPTQLERPYLHTAAEARGTGGGGHPEEGVVLSSAQLIDRLGGAVAASAPLGAFVFPAIGAREAGWSLEPLPPAEVAQRLAANRYGAALGARGATVIEDAVGAAPTASRPGFEALAELVPGFSLGLAADCHREPGFAAALRNALVPCYPRRVVLR